jgi:hypothetical protein
MHKYEISCTQRTGRLDKEHRKKHFVFITIATLQLNFTQLIRSLAPITPIYILCESQLTKRVKVKHADVKTLSFFLT